jgi:hypothetical protein
MAGNCDWSVRTAAMDLALFFSAKTTKKAASVSAKLNTTASSIR